VLIVEAENKFIKYYSTSVFMIYAGALLVFVFLSFVESEEFLARLTTAIGVSAFFMIVGELLTTPFRITAKLYRGIKEYISACNSLDETNDRRFITIFCEDNDSVNKSKTEYETRISFERTLSHIGMALFTIGLIVFIVIIGSEEALSFIPVFLLPYFTILSFFVLMISMIYKGYSDIRGARTQERIKLIYSYLESNNEKDSER
jgi:uncharacterized membrane protein